jgi:hypothetical protein
MRPLRNEALGILHDDLERVAAIAARLCADHPLTVWVDHCDPVYIDLPTEVVHAPRDYIVGTYNGHWNNTSEKIARDLAEMKLRHGRIR